MAIDLVTRTQWQAKAPSGSYTRLASTKGVKIHYTGGSVPARIVDDHNLCVKLVRDVQIMHMSGGREQPYADIGYNLAVCPHRKVFVGRGPHALPAANGPGLNSGHYAILALLGNSGYTAPTDALLHGICDAIEYLRANGDAGREIKGHRDGYATECPGEPLYAWVRRGAPRPATPKPPAETWTEKTVKQLPTLRIGAGAKDNDPVRWDVKTAHYLLHARAYPPPAGTADTVYGDGMLDAVRAFQRAKGLDPDGIVGPKTWAALLKVT